MFHFKKRLEEKKQRSKAIVDSQHWKHHPELQGCLQAMRGCCTVAPMELHEAVIAAVNIALLEDSWTVSTEIPSAFLEGTVYLVWDNEKLPVLRAPWELVEENLTAVSTVAAGTFLVAETMDRIVHCSKQGGIRLYSIA